MNEQAERILIGYIKERFPEEDAPWRREEFAQRSYSQWAANEILLRVMDHPMTPAILIIEEFMLRMDLYSCTNPKTSLIFSIAKDTAEDIILLFV